MKPALGVCYYPEHWPQAIWQDDAKRMRDMGLRWVRIGEFAWSRLEPSPNQFEWQWLDDAIAILAKENLNIVLGTPTATPPRWMLNKHPDILAVDSHGNTRGFGSRRHYDFSHQAYREEAVRICSLLAERYAHNEAIGFWQTDNEYGCHNTTRSYSPLALAGFRQWLQEKYHTIDALNQQWGNVFWSMVYREFDDINLPNQSVTEVNPIHHLDFYRFASDQVRAFNLAQVKAIRQYDKDTPILHNYMGRECDFDHFAVGNDIDAASWDSYPLGFLEDRINASPEFKATYMRQGDPDFQAMHHDLYRAIGKGRWWVMEQQPGPVNWAPYNPAPAKGMVRLWAWEAIAHGAEVVSFFRWRQAPFAQEQMHAGLLRPDNQDAPAVEEIKQLQQEIKSLDESTKQADVAIVFDYESHWAWQIQPQGKDFDYFNIIFDYYKALRQLGLSIDFCSSNTADLNHYKLVVAPALMTCKPTLTKAFENFTGTLLLGPRTAAKTEDFAIPENLPPNLEQLIDIKVRYVESLPRHCQIAIDDIGQITTWRESIEYGDNVEVILNSTDQEAVLLKQNSVYYLGALLDNAAFKHVLLTLCQTANLQTETLPEGVRLRRYGSKQVLINYNVTAVDIIDLNCAKAFTTTLINPADVLISTS